MTGMDASEDILTEHQRMVADAIVLERAVLVIKRRCPVGKGFSGFTIRITCTVLMGLSGRMRTAAENREAGPWPGWRKR